MAAAACTLWRRLYVPEAEQWEYDFDLRYADGTIAAVEVSTLQSPKTLNSPGRMQ
jgi:hypothetical protein